MSILPLPGRRSLTGGAPRMPSAIRTFPLRVAGVDVGSNGIRFIAAEFSGPTQYRILESDRAAVRLGRGAFRNHRLEPRAMTAALRALARFRKRIRALDIRECRWVATSAVRESANGEAFAALVKRRLGLDLEIIAGSEEVRLVALAVKTRIAFGTRRWIVANVGGGSAEVALVDRRGVIRNESHSMGAVRLLAELSGSAETREPGRFLHLLEDYVSTLQLQSVPDAVRAAGFIATGGNIEEVARLAGTPVRRGTASLPLPALRRVIAELSALSPRRRARKWRLKNDRADVILPAAVVLERLCALAGKQVLRVPFIGTKEGLLLDGVDRLAAHGPREHERQILNAAVGLGRRYHFDEAHGLQVARLASELFTQLRSLHRLDENDYRVLLAAAVLHDIGVYISYKRHHKHSLYLISQSEMPGLTQNEMLMAANVARYHRKSGPRDGHEHYRRLSPDRRERVAKLSALLRLADALDREHLQNVRRLRARTRPDRLLLEVTGEVSPELERWAVKRKAELFTQVFKRKVKIVHARKRQRRFAAEGTEKNDERP